MQALVRFALQQRVLVLVLVFALLIGGLFSFLHLPIEAFPDVQDVQVQIITQNPGQAPEEIERSITLPIEREVNGIPGLVQVRSVSMTGLSVVTLTFGDGTTDYFARQQAHEHLLNVNFPDGVQPSLGPLTTAVGQIFFYYLKVPKGMSDVEARSIQDWIVRPAIRQVPGIADVTTTGGAVQTLQVDLDPQRMAQRNIRFTDIENALQSNNNNIGAATLRAGDQALVVRVIGLVDAVRQLGEISVQNAEGKIFFLNDLANIHFGERPRTGYMAHDHENSVVTGIVSALKGQNAQEVSKKIKEKLDSIKTQLPAGVEVVPYYQRTDLIQHTVDTVGENLVVGSFLIIALLLVFLRNVWGAISVAVIIPLALLFAFIIMDQRGISANLISLGSVDFGIIIDSAVVLVEAFMARLAVDHLAEQSLSPAKRYGKTLQVLQRTTVEVGRPILFSKAIIILAFLPIFTFQRVEGKIFSPMAFTISAALIGAIILTLTLTPALLSLFAEKHDMAEKHLKWVAWLQQKYKEIIVGAMRRWKLAIGASFAIFFTSLILLPFLGSEFLPKLDEGNIWLTVTLPTASSLQNTKKVEEFVRSTLLSYPEVTQVTAQTGRPDDGTDPKGTNMIQTMADLKPHKEWRFASKEALIADMSKKLHEMPGLETNFSQVIEDNVQESLSGVKGELAVKLFGPDLEVLTAKANEIANIIKHVPGNSDVAAIKTGGLVEMDIQLDRQRLAAMHLNVDQVAHLVQGALSGSTVGSYFDGNRKLDIVLRGEKGDQASVDQVKELPIILPDGSMVQLSSLANVQIKNGASAIYREQGSRIALVKSNVSGRAQGDFVKDAMHQVDSKVKLPPGYHLLWGGQFENQQRAMKRLAVIVPLSLGLIFLLLFWAFQSMKQALMILAMLPFIAVGALTGLALAGLHLSVSAAVGFIALAGIAVQNAVIMLEQIRLLMDNGEDSYHAIINGAEMRLRPILMTALMAGLGLLPSALSHGIGSETQRPFAVVIVCGVVSGTIFTLLLLPVFASRLWKVDANNPPTQDHDAYLSHEMTSGA